MKVIGVDVGGTFTDIVYCDMSTGDVAIHKVSTTPDDPSRAIIEGVTEICAAAGAALSPSTIFSTAPRPRPTRCSSTKARVPAW